MEVGAIEDGLDGWLHIGLISTSEFFWVPHEIVSHTCAPHPQTNLFWYILLKVKLDAINNET